MSAGIASLPWFLFSSNLQQLVAMKPWVICPEHTSGPWHRFLWWLSFLWCPIHHILTASVIQNWAITRLTLWVSLLKDHRCKLAAVHCLKSSCLTCFVQFWDVYGKKSSLVPFTPWQLEAETLFRYLSREVEYPIYTLEGSLWLQSQVNQWGTRSGAETQHVAEAQILKKNYFFNKYICSVHYILGIILVLVLIHLNITNPVI